MATDNTVQILRQRIDKILAFDEKRLIRRPNDWGAITFEEGGKDIRRVFEIADYLKALPVEVLVDSTAQEISASLEECRVYINQIDTFTLETGNPAATRNQFISQIHQAGDALFLRASPWIPFLAYKKGDVTKNIAALTEAVAKASGIVSEAKTDIQNKSSEIDTIITKAREASGAAGAAVFTKDFSARADALEVQAKTWLTRTTWMAAITLLGSVAAFFCIDPTMGKIEVVQRLAAKVAIYGVLLTGTVWCGRIYKALMHQAAMNRFKALGLQTFQAFTAGSTDVQTKDAVLLETTRSIFASYQTGYIDEESGTDTRVVEVLKSTIPQSGG